MTRGGGIPCILALIKIVENLPSPCSIYVILKYNLENRKITWKQINVQNVFMLFVHDVQLFFTFAVQSVPASIDTTICHDFPSTK